MAEARRVCLGTIVGAHGVRGLVRIKSFTENPADLTAYGPLGDAAGGRCIAVTVTGQARGALLARIEGVNDRAAAVALSGTKLYVPRPALRPLDEAETYYHADLIGLDAEDEGGRLLGRVSSVHNFGAGDVIEIDRPEAAPLLIPFTRAGVPAVDLARRRLVVAAPDEGEPE